MQRNTVMFAFVAVVVLIGGYFFITGGTPTDSTTTTAVESAMPVPGENTPEMVVEEIPVTHSMKEFTMTAYYDEKGKWFSLKEITVKKGDTVRVNITNTKGMHDFTIDELGIKQDLPLNQPVTIDFVATKTGDFVYYCSMPGHRTGGQWGTLHITE